MTQKGNVPFILGFIFYDTIAKIYIHLFKPHNDNFSFDIDVLDPSEAPATGTRVRGGLTLRSKRPELTETFDRDGVAQNVDSCI